MKPTKINKLGSETHTFSGELRRITLSCGHYRGEFTFYETPPQEKDFWHGTISIETPGGHEIVRRCFIEWHAWHPDLPESFWRAITNNITLDCPLNKRLTRGVVEIIAERLLDIFERRPDSSISDERGINLHQIDPSLFLAHLREMCLLAA